MAARAAICGSTGSKARGTMLETPVESDGKVACTAAGGTNECDYIKAIEVHREATTTDYGGKFQEGGGGSAGAAGRRLRILCLHGFRQTGRSLRGRTRALQRKIKDLAELVYIDAPHELLPARMHSGQAVGEEEEKEEEEAQRQHQAREEQEHRYEDQGQEEGRDQEEEKGQMLQQQQQQQQQQQWLLRHQQEHGHDQQQQQELHEQLQQHPNQQQQEKQHQERDKQMPQPLALQRQQQPDQHRAAQRVSPSPASLSFSRRRAWLVSQEDYARQRHSRPDAPCGAHASRGQAVRSSDSAALMAAADRSRGRAGRPCESDSFGVQADTAARSHEAASACDQSDMSVRSAQATARTQQEQQEQQVLQVCGWEESLKLLLTVLHRDGPFDGVLGFSQGAAVAAALACWLADTGGEREEGTAHRR